MKDYSIIKRNSLEGLEQDINSYLNLGYICVGGPILLLERQLFFQAIALPIEKKLGRPKKEQ